MGHSKVVGVHAGEPVQGTGAGSGVLACVAASPGGSVDMVLRKWKHLEVS